MAMILYGGTLRIGLATSALVSLLVMNFIVFVGFVATGGSLTTRNVFTTIALMYHLGNSCLFFASRAGFFLSEATVANRRIQVRTCIYM